MTMERYDTPQYEQLLAFVWQNGLFFQDNLFSRDGEAVSVRWPGRRNTGPGPQFLDAEVTIGGRSRTGNVAIHARSSDWGYYKRNYDPQYDAVILNVVAEDDRQVRKVDDTPLASLSIRFSEKLRRVHEALLRGADRGACGYHLTRQLNEIGFKSLCTRLMIDRLERKVNDILAIYESVERSWHETFHVLLFRTMGLGSNKEIYMSLARNVPYSRLCQERGELKNIEAMLFGVAGLLDEALYDEYKSDLVQRFETLRHKHQLRVLSYCQWSDRGVRPYNFVPKRIAQIASLIDSDEFTFQNMLACREVKEVVRLFSVGLPEYWRRSFSFGKRAPVSQKAIGAETIDILIINLVVPILFAYGRLQDEPELEERAIDFLYRTRAEKNRYTESWSKHGVKIDHALASQALIQLSTEHCQMELCCDCTIGSRVLKDNL